MEIPSYLCPDSTKFEFNQWLLDKTQKYITLKLTSKQTLVDCPGCYQPTHRIHSYYERILNDLPWADYNISIQLRVRKFFCSNSECSRRIFTERLEKLASPWARRTQRLTDQLTAVAIEARRFGGSKANPSLGSSSQSQYAFTVNTSPSLAANSNSLNSWSRRLCLPQKKDLRHSPSRFRKKSSDSFTQGSGGRNTSQVVEGASRCSNRFTRSF